MFELLIELPRWIFEIAFVVYVITITGFVVLERRKPTSALAWILGLVFIPVFGLVLYLALGRPRMRRYRRRRERRALRAVEDTRNMAKLDAIPADLSEAQRGLVRLALHTAAAPLRRANRVRR